MFDRLPDWVDPARLAAQAREISGFLPLSEMPRLAAALTGTGGQASATFVFTRTPGGVDRVAGHVEALLPVRCQRCLQPMDLPVSHDFEARLVSSEAELDDVPDSEDAVWFEIKGLSLHALLEDELLLSLPVVALHGEGSACTRRGMQEFTGRDVAGARREDGPFAALKSLKRERDEEEGH